VEHPSSKFRVKQLENPWKKKRIVYVQCVIKSFKPPFRVFFSFKLIFTWWWNILYCE